ncbi:MAG: hypothetical protein ABJA83_02085 [Burkholderiaceae bacterium]
MKFLLTAMLGLLATGAGAQGSGGLYIAGGTFDFARTIERAIAQSPSGSRFFVLATGDAVRALSLLAADEAVEARNLGAQRGAVYLVCQRDIEREVIRTNDLASGVIAVRGWPAAGSDELPEGTLYYRNEDPANLPKSTELLRRLRATCS